MKIVIKLIKKAVIAISIIYTLNVILSGTNLFIPINVPTILVGMALGPFGIASLILVLVINGL